MKSKKDIMFDRMKERKKQVKTVRRIVFVIALVLLLALAGLGYWGYNYVKEALQPIDAESEETVTVEVPIGSGISSISQLLEDNGLVKDARIYEYYVKFNNQSDFQAGTYDLTPSMTLDEITESLKTGKVYHEPVFSITVPEGLHLEEIASRVIAERTNYTAEQFMELIQSDAFIDEMMAKYPTLLTDEIKGENIRYALEGYLFPATYPFYEENPPLAHIAEEMIRAMDANVLPLLPALEEQERTVHWLLTFSSLLEEEATSKSDREAIASVFYNRLNDGMKLQTDPTVIYAQGEHKERLLFSDYEFDHPYNTYVTPALPPGPIAGAGRASLEAALDPATTDYFYFLADSEGTNHFSKTYEEHLEKSAQYIGN